MWLSVYTKCVDVAGTESGDSVAGRVLETDRHCCDDVAGTESGQTVWQAECGRQTDIAVLMLQAGRVDRQCGRRSAGDRQTLLC